MQVILASWQENILTSISVYTGPLCSDRHKANCMYMHMYTGWANDSHNLTNTRIVHFIHTHTLTHSHSHTLTHTHTHTHTHALVHTHTLTDRHPIDVCFVQRIRQLLPRVSLFSRKKVPQGLPLKSEDRDRIFLMARNPDEFYKTIINLQVGTSVCHRFEIFFMILSYF